MRTHPLNRHTPNGAPTDHLCPQLATQERGEGAAASAQLEAHLHTLQRARRAEKLAEAPPALPLQSYCERAPLALHEPAPRQQLRRPVDDDGRDATSTDGSSAAAERWRDGRFPRPEQLLASGRPAEALRLAAQGQQFAPGIIEVSPGDSRCTVVFAPPPGTVVVTASALLNDGTSPRPIVKRRILSAEEAFRGRTSITIRGLANFAEYIVTVEASAKDEGAEERVACLCTPLPSVPVEPTILSLKTYETSIDIEAELSSSDEPLTSLTARLQRSTEEHSRVAAVVPAAAAGKYRISLPGLSPGGRYAVGLSASNAAGEGESCVFWATLKPALPPPVTIVSAAPGDGCCELLLTADSANNIEQLKIWTIAAGEAEARVASVLRRPTQLTSGLRVCVTGLANWVIYRVAVASVARDGTEGTPSHVEVRPRK